MESDFINDADDLRNFPRRALNRSDRLHRIGDHLARALGPRLGVRDPHRRVGGEALGLIDGGGDLVVGGGGFFQGGGLHLSAAGQFRGALAHLLGGGGNGFAGFADIDHGAAQLFHGEVKVAAQAAILFGEGVVDAQRQITRRQIVQTVRQTVHHALLFGGGDTGLLRLFGAIGLLGSAGGIGFQRPIAEHFDGRGHGPHLVLAVGMGGADAQIAISQSRDDGGDVGDRPNGAVAEIGQTSQQEDQQAC